MAYNKQPQQPMSVVLKSNFVLDLQKSLHLTQKQVMVANSTALALSSSPTLYNCNKLSIIKYCYEVVRFNFHREDCCYPVPYNGYIQCQISYKGFKEKAMESGNYNDVNAVCVYECDRIARDIDTGRPIVIFETDFAKTKGKKVIGYYAYAKDKDNKICNSVYWSKEDCEKHGKTYSKTYSSTWGKTQETFNKMALKTVIKQLCNELSFVSKDLHSIIESDQIVFGKDGNTYADNKTADTKETNVSNVIEIPEDDAPAAADDSKKVNEKNKPEKAIRTTENDHSVEKPMLDKKVEKETVKVEIVDPKDKLIDPKDHK